MSSLTGAGKLVRLILRRDRILLPLWVLFLGLVPLSYVKAINGLFPDAAGRQSYFDASAHNAGFVTLYGRLLGSSLGELVAWRAGFIPMMIGIVVPLTVIRHTRTEEDTGRRELLGSTVLGRHAGLAAALLTTCVASLVMGAVLAAGMVGQQLPGAGSVAFGLEFAVTGWLFAGVAAVAAQLTSGAGSARGIAITTIGVAYVLRTVGDVSAITDGPLSWVSWVSPISWAQRIEPYGANQWWPALLVIAAAVALMVVAVALSARRDIGAGLLPQRLGPAAAARSLRSPLGLAWRLHRGLLAAWTAGFLALGVVLGYLAADVGDLVNGNKQMTDIFARLGGAQGLVDNYLAGMLGLFGLIAAAYGIQAALRARTEELSRRVEPLLATAVSRYRVAGSHLVFALLGPAVVLVVAGLAMGLTHGLNTGDVGGQVPRMLAGAVVQLPAVWTLSAITVVLFGLVPRLAAVAWAALAACIVLNLVGGALQFQQWIMDISPFTHLPRLPGGEVTAVPMLALVLIAIVLTAGGLVAFRRRDVPVT